MEKLSVFQSMKFLAKKTWLIWVVGGFVPNIVAMIATTSHSATWFLWFSLAVSVVVGGFIPLIYLRLSKKNPERVSIRGEIINIVLGTLVTWIISLPIWVLFLMSI